MPRGSGADVSDRDVERARYDAAAMKMLKRGQQLLTNAHPDLIVPDLDHIQEPYNHFHASIRDLITHDSVVLEIGAGSGQHTRVIAATGARTMTLDISLQSLKVGISASGAGVRPICADMEALPLKGGRVDSVVCAGALSYADPVILDSEIRRVLKPGGNLIVVDSLNHNPVYRVNRWFHYRRGQRTVSTLQRMPDQRRIAGLMRGFDQVEIRRYGTFVFLYPIVSRLAGRLRASRACVFLDHRIGGGRNAFKFVLVARGYRPMETSGRR